MSDTFERLAQDAISAAERVDVPFEDFVHGLETMVVTLRDRLELAEDELKQKPWLQHGARAEEDDP